MIVRVSPGFRPFELLVEVVDLDAADAAGAGDDLGVVLVADDVAVDLHVHVGGQVVLVLDAAVLDRDERALLLAQVLIAWSTFSSLTSIFGFLTLIALEVRQI